MRRSRGGFAAWRLAASAVLAIAVLALTALIHAGAPGERAFAQGSPCDQFPQINGEAQKRGAAVTAAIKAKADRKQVCTLMTTFVNSEAAVLKFLEDNKTWCGVPDQIITMTKANHEKSLKFRTAACSEDAGPRPKAPTLSDAIKQPTVDSTTTTKAGSGTFDTLTGSPLGR
jgi:hypothetical protein